MSKPPVYPSQTTAGISIHPRTLERVIPESRRPDGSVRKELKIRPGYTPQEDVSRFRGSRQQQLDRNTLPKGHILGWVAPSSEIKKSVPQSGDDKPLSKSAAKNAKRKAKKQADKDRVVKENWEDEEEADANKAPTKQTNGKVETERGTSEEVDVDVITSKIRNLEVQRD